MLLALSLHHPPCSLPLSLPPSFIPSPPTLLHTHWPPYVNYSSRQDDDATPLVDRGPLYLYLPISSLTGTNLSLDPRTDRWLYLFVLQRDTRPIQHDDNACSSEGRIHRSLSLSLFSAIGIGPIVIIRSPYDLSDYAPIFPTTPASNWLSESVFRSYSSPHRVRWLYSHQVISPVTFATPSYLIHSFVCGLRGVKVIPILADFVSKLITSYFGSFSLKSYSGYFHSSHRSGILSTCLGAVYIINYFLRTCFKCTCRFVVSSHSSIFFYPPSYCPRQSKLHNLRTDIILTSPSFSDAVL
ncbi:hypothetical protein C8J57DRAFT_1464484 [Mycena rebaudengoi]|nr:hypothetical protein C8J57DRAFT_1464484 [Mycena rebaudengoi]